MTLWEVPESVCSILMFQPLSLKPGSQICSSQVNMVLELEVEMPESNTLSSLTSRESVSNNIHQKGL